MSIFFCYWGNTKLTCKGTCYDLMWKMWGNETAWDGHQDKDGYGSTAVVHKHCQWYTEIKEKIKERKNTVKQLIFAGDIN